MIIKIAGGNGGWGNYVLNGSKEKPRDPEKIKILKGDIELGDRITSAGNWKENEYKIVLGFKGQPSEEKINEALEDFEKLFMHGFEKDEYHMDAVLHKDTDDYHVHIRIPKMNLKTETQLRLYMHSADKKRKELIADYIDIKHGFESPRENKRLVKSEVDYINEWRAERQQKPFDFTKKKGRAEAVEAINGLVFELHEAGLINTRDDMQAAFQDYGLIVEKLGYDKNDEFHYITLSNSTGKIRVKGDIYGEQFWQHSRADRTEQIRDNRTSSDIFGRDTDQLKAIERELNRELEKRKQVLDGRYKTARERADEKYQVQQAEGEKRVNELREGREEREEALNGSNRGYAHRNDRDYSEKQHRAMEGSSRVQENGQRWSAVHGSASQSAVIYKRQKKRIFGNRGLINGRSGNFRAAARGLRAQRIAKQRTLRTARAERRRVHTEFKSNHLNAERFRDRRENTKAFRRGRAIGEAVRAAGRRLAELTARFEDARRKSEQTSEQVVKFLDGVFTAVGKANEIDLKGLQEAKKQRTREWKEREKAKAQEAMRHQEQHQAPRTSTFTRGM